MPLTVFVGGILFVVLLFFLFPPSAFPVHHSFEVKEGIYLMSLSQELAEQSIVRSPLLLRFFIRLFASERDIIAGTYFWEQPLSTSVVAWRLTHGWFGIEPVKVTIPEGVTVREMAAILEKYLPTFAAEKFVLLATPLEGYLFPDTYFFPPDTTAEKVIDKMRANFKRQLMSLQPWIVASGLPLPDIITMASLLEEEASLYDTRRVIAGILWKRLASNMPLQVDAIFVYILGKNSFELTTADLQVDSTYNTYKYTGLPAGPITNPGRESILAAILPLDSPYWFYLSDRSGNMHYARDFNEHKANKQRYLR